eukprot:scaffold10020_cov161-Skeletonema_marinoi.AAC.9
MNPLRRRRGRKLYDEIQLYSIIGCKLSSSRGRRGKQRKFLDMINWTIDAAMLMKSSHTYNTLAR